MLLKCLTDSYPSQCDTIITSIQCVDTVHPMFAVIYFQMEKHTFKWKASDAIDMSDTYDSVLLKCLT